MNDGTRVVTRGLKLIMVVALMIGVMPISGASARPVAGTSIVVVVSLLTAVPAKRSNVRGDVKRKPSVVPPAV